MLSHTPVEKSVVLYVYMCLFVVDRLARSVREGRPHMLDDRDGSIFFFYYLVHDEYLSSFFWCVGLCASAEGCSSMQDDSHYTIITVGPPAVLG